MTQNQVSTSSFGCGIQPDGKRLVRRPSVKVTTCSHFKCHARQELYRLEHGARRDGQTPNKKTFGGGVYAFNTLLRNKCKRACSTRGLREKSLTLSCTTQGYWWTSALALRWFLVYEHAWRKYQGGMFSQTCCLAKHACFCFSSHPHLVKGLFNGERAFPYPGRSR